jgi:hypothetical protein
VTVVEVRVGAVAVIAKAVVVTQSSLSDG